MPLRYRRVTFRFSPESFGQPEQLLRHEWRGGLILSFAPTSEWRPNADVYETASNLVVNVELAGMREEDIEVTLFEDVLLVAGRREQEPGADRPLRFHEATIRYGSFQAAIALPLPIDRQRVAARYDRGFLKVTLPILRSAERRVETRR
jgi:HSP20 family molecular chaperone IbpA